MIFNLTCFHIADLEKKHVFKNNTKLVYMRKIINVC